MDHPADLAAVGRGRAGAGLGQDAATQAGDRAGAVAHDVLARHAPAVAQAHGPARPEPLPVLAGLVGVVAALDPHAAGHHHRPAARLADVGRERRRVEHGRARIGGDQLVPPEQLDLERVEHGHDPRRVLVEVVAHAALEPLDLDHRVVLGHADDVAEGADGLGPVAAPAQAGQGRHARVVPAAHGAAGDQLQQLALGHHRVVEREAGELVLARARRPRPGVVEHPVVQLAVVLELERADRVGDALDRVLERVRVVVHRVDAPGVAGAVVLGVADPVQQRIAHLHVRRRHVDLGAQHAGAVGELAGLHAPQQVEVVGHGAVTERRWPTRLGQGAAVLPDLLVGQVTHVGQAVVHEALGQLVHAREVVGREQHRGRREAEPAHVVLDRLDVLDVLLGRVGVVVAEVAGALVVAGQPEVEADRLGVADVQVAVGLGREAGRDPGVPAGGQVGVDDVAEEVGALGRGHGRRTVAAPARPGDRRRPRGAVRARR